MKQCHTLILALTLVVAAHLAADLLAKEPPAAPAPGGRDLSTAAKFSFKLPKGGMTSAGVFDRHGRVVRSLWALRKLPAGTHTERWDARSDVGSVVSPGEYTFRVVVNGSTYRNVGAIGNSGRPPTPEGHTPTTMLSVAVDAAGGVYTANGWDEAGADFKKWDPNGKSVYDAHYQIRNGNPNGAPYSITVDDKTIYCGMGGWASKPWNAKQQLQRFRLSDGKGEKFTKVADKAGHIQIHEWPAKKVPPDTPPADAERMKAPLQAVAVRGEILLAADALSGKIRRYHKVTGEPRGEFPVKLPCALAVDAAGRIWVGHQHKFVSVFSPEGKKLAGVLDDIGEVEAIAFGPAGRLYVADGAAGMVKIYDVAGDKAALRRTLGRKAKAPDRAADRFYRLKGVAVDRTGCVVTIQNEPAGGARLARWDGRGKLLWEQFGCEFVSLGNYGRHDPNTLYSMTFHRYRLGDHARGQWEYTGFVLAGTRKYSSHVHGVPRLLRLGGKDFWFMPTGDGLQVYRVDGEVLRLASILGAGWPDPRGKQGKPGQWSWSDAAGDGKVDAGEVKWFKKPGKANYAVFGVDVDARGDVWLGEHHTRAIWTVPRAGLDQRGNPTYDWARARQAVTKDTSPLEFRPSMAQHAEDGSIYAFGFSKAFPGPKGNPFWMGGTTLIRFDAKGKRLWVAKLPAVCVGMDVIPGRQGGCILGTGVSATLHHYSADGLRIGSVSPGEAMGGKSGWMDNHASVAVNRDPRDGLLDVFAEDDYILRIGWYRIDDRPIETITGTFTVTKENLPADKVTGADGPPPVAPF